ncbi:MAG: hypothetical protein ETSY1_28170 [Candidatus Entotheonella factor]|uniref:Ribbon-helix-helix protein CopG domain-containing protein n=1 Tax=Entotheonella factor TaxID=1429438 RepID=W4LEB3_ENTF1|nr:MAG: hypothetical protein ETSY1_28170 [Candidatus Entotheonella factor]
MSTLILELPDEQIQKLDHLAQQKGTSINDVLIEIIHNLTSRGDLPGVNDIIQDPIFNIKAHDIDAPTDLSQHVDRYLYGKQ